MVQVQNYRDGHSTIGVIKFYIGGTKLTTSTFSNNSEKQTIRYIATKYIQLNIRIIWSM